MRPSERSRLIDEYLGMLDTSAALLSPMAAQIPAGWAGILSGGDAENVRAVMDALTWEPKTAEGQRNMGYVADAMGAISQIPLAPSNSRTPGNYRPATVGDVGAGTTAGWNDAVVPWLQDTAGDSLGSGIAATGLGILAAGLPPPARSAGNVQRWSQRLLSGEIDAGTYRKNLAKAGYLTEEDVQSIPRGREKSIAGVLAESPGMNAGELAEAALAGWPKRGWYRDSAKAIQDIFGGDSKRFAYLLSALSPQTSVESNLKNAVNVWANWNRAGRPTDKSKIMQIMGESVEGDKGIESVLDAWKNNSLRALTADNLDTIRFSGPKVSSFARNLVGELGEVTNDAWMAKALDVNQNIFAGQTSKASGVDEFGSIGGQGAGYQAANAVVREAGDILTKRFKDQGIEVTPAEVQEMVWSYAKPLWEARDAEGNLRGMSALYDEGVLTDQMIAGTPDFGTLLANTPEYRSSLEGIGLNFGNLSPHAQHAPRPVAPDPRRMRSFNERFEERYRRDTIPSEMLRTVNSILQGNSQFTEPGRLRQAGWTHGVKGRPIEPTPHRGERLRSLGFDTSGFLQLEPGEAAGSLFQQYMRDATSKHKFGDSVDVHDVEKYAGSDLYLAPQGRGGFALDDGNVISAFSKPGNPDRRFADNLLLAGVNQGGRYLDAFDTMLPVMYSRAGFKPSSRLAFDPTQAPDNWDYQKYSAFNEGKPDVMTMVLDPRNSELLMPNMKPYDRQSPKAQQSRIGILADDYEKYLQMQADELARIRASGLYPGY